MYGDYFNIGEFHIIPELTQITLYNLRIEVPTADTQVSELIIYLRGAAQQKERQASTMTPRFSLFWQPCLHIFSECHVDQLLCREELSMSTTTFFRGYMQIIPPIFNATLARRTFYLE